MLCISCPHYFFPHTTVQDMGHWDILDPPPIQDPFTCPLPRGTSLFPSHTVDPAMRTLMPLIHFHLVVTTVTTHLPPVTLTPPTQPSRSLP